MSKKYQTGFSLLEVLVSVIVISFGLLGLAGLQITSLKGVNNAHSQNIASILTMDLSERMRSNRQGVSGGYYGVSVSCSTPVKQCRGTETCSPEQTAVFDLQEVMCGTAVGDTNQGGARNLLPNGNLTVVCIGGCDQPDVAHNVTITWGKNAIHQSQGNDSNIAMLTTSIMP